ncbi:GPCR fungal pheromone mating factor [Mrakia frigida]|uniref:pheromone receptor n=1 Tax=Mrakia frigida TaxID=29902 RepID=UPI003FCC0FE8
MVLLLLASPPHFRSGNIGAICLVLWSFIGCLGFFVNAIVWWDNVENKAPVFCDIWAKLTIGLISGISSACLCINRRLKIISSARRTTVSSRERRWAVWIDIAIAVIPPVLFMALHYTVQGNRYNIFDGYGCQAATYTDWHGVVEVYLPPLLLGSISFVYGGISIYNFSARRRQFQSVLQQSGGGLNTSRFIRLISLSLLEMMLTVPLAIWSIAYIFRYALKPTLSWADTHADFSRVDTFTGEALLASGGDIVSRATLQRWIPVFAAFTYFCFFGAQEEALLSYWKAFNRVKGARFGKKARADA